MEVPAYRGDEAPLVVEPGAIRIVDDACRLDEHLDRVGDATEPECQVVGTRGCELAAGGRGVRTDGPQQLLGVGEAMSEGECPAVQA